MSRQQDFIRGEVVISELLAQRAMRPRYFRHPYLNTGPDLETKKKFEKFLEERNYQIAPVTVESKEWLFSGVYNTAMNSGDEQTMHQVAGLYVPYMERVLEFFERLSVEVIGYEIPQILLLHPSWLNANHLDELCAMLKHRGYTFIGLEQALLNPAYHHADNYIGPIGISWLKRWALTSGIEDGSEPVLPTFMKQFE